MNDVYKSRFAEKGRVKCQVQGSLRFRVRPTRLDPCLPSRGLTSPEAPRFKNPTIDSNALCYIKDDSSSMLRCGLAQLDAGNESF